MRNVSCSVCPAGFRTNAESGSTGCELCPIDTINLDGLECTPCAQLMGVKSASNEERTECHCINGTEYVNDRLWTGFDWLVLEAKKCNDINECLPRPLTNISVAYLAPCDVLVDCVNVPKGSPFDPGYYCTECPTGFVGDGIVAHGGCYPEAVHVAGGQEPYEPSIPMTVAVTNVGDISDAGSEEAVAYKQKLAASLAAELGIDASLIQITTFEATERGGRRRQLQAETWLVDFNFVVKGPDSQTILAGLDSHMNGTMGLELEIDGVVVPASFPVQYETVGGVVQLAQQSVYDVMQMRCPLITFLDNVTSACVRCDPGTMVNDDQTGCTSCALHPGQYSTAGEPCQSCPGGTEPNYRRTMCTGCPQNYFSGDGIACIRCPAFQVTRLLPMQTTSDACVCDVNMYDITEQSPKLSCFKHNGDLLAEAPVSASLSARQIWTALQHAGPSHLGLCFRTLGPGRASAARWTGRACSPTALAATTTTTRPPCSSLATGAQPP